MSALLVRPRFADAISWSYVDRWRRLLHVCGVLPGRRPVRRANTCPLPPSSPLRDEAYLTATSLLGSHHNEIGGGRGQTPVPPTTVGPPLPPAHVITAATAFVHSEGADRG